jgi:LmbE family N-acetylglucosaminyl deacetylase
MTSILAGLRHRLSSGRAGAALHNSRGLQKVEDFFRGPSIDWEPGDQKVVVLAPHRDDEVIGCGGTVARHADAGADVSVIYLSDDRGGAAQRAFAVLGVKKFYFLGCEGTPLQGGSGVAGKLRARLLEIRPDIVYLPFFLERHPDHRAVSRILIAATEGTDLSFQCHGFEVWTPLFPNCAVWIDASMERKKQAMAQHASSSENDNDLLHAMIGLASYRSVLRSRAQGRYAEAFCVLPLQEYAQAYRSFAP